MPSPTILKATFLYQGDRVPFTVEYDAGIPLQDARKIQGGVSAVISDCESRGDRPAAAIDAVLRFIEADGYAGRLLRMQAYEIAVAVTKPA